MRVIITGSRMWPETGWIAGIINNILDGLWSQFGSELTIVHGNCPTGADNVAERWCLWHHITPQHFDAHWNVYGNAAGPLRNREMVAAGGDLLIAFNLNNSSGTNNCLKLGKQARIPTWEVKITL